MFETLVWFLNYIIQNSILVLPILIYLKLLCKQYIASGHVQSYQKDLKIAVMGCVVNGPGEAKDADLGIAGGENDCLIFKKGEPYKKVAFQDAEEEFFKEIRLLLNE